MLPWCWGWTHWRCWRWEASRHSWTDSLRPCLRRPLRCHCHLPCASCWRRTLLRAPSSHASADCSGPCTSSYTQAPCTRTVSAHHNTYETNTIGIQKFQEHYTLNKNFARLFIDLNHSCYLQEVWILSSTQLLLCNWSMIFHSIVWNMEHLQITDRW